MAVQKVCNTAAFDQRQKWLVVNSKVEALVTTTPSECEKGVRNWSWPLNPLSPNIHIQILQTDLHTFPS